jgi:hypothetical protein
MKRSRQESKLKLRQLQRLQQRRRLKRKLPSKKRRRKMIRRKPLLRRNKRRQLPKRHKKRPLKSKLRNLRSRMWLYKRLMTILQATIGSFMETTPRQVSHC